jgi:hypothetical protein
MDWNWSFDNDTHAAFFISGLYFSTSDDSYHFLYIPFSPKFREIYIEYFMIVLHSVDLRSNATKHITSRQGIYTSLIVSLPESIDRP